MTSRDRCCRAVRARPRRLPNPSPAEQQAAIKAALDVAGAERPPREGVVDLARETLRETTDFVRAKKFRDACRTSRSTSS